MPEADPTMTQPPAPPITSGQTALAIGATIDRIKQIAAESGDHLLLSDGPPHPDFKLLDLCGDILHGMKRIAQMEIMQRKAGDHSRECGELKDEIQIVKNRISPLFGYAKRIKATTGAGIYAKALVCRHSESGAARLAMSLAEDLVASPQLRAALWQDEEGRFNG